MSFNKNILNISEVLKDDNNRPTTSSMFEISQNFSTSQVNTEPDIREQKSFISIHCTDHLIQESKDSCNDPIDCNVEILSVKDQFHSTSEDSITTNDDDEKKLPSKKNSIKNQIFAPSNSKSMTNSDRLCLNEMDNSLVFSDFNIPSSTMYVIGSNPGEPKKVFTSPPRKLTKAMKKSIRKADKRKTDTLMCKGVNKLTTRGILKDNRRYTTESTGDALHGGDVIDKLCDDPSSDTTMDYSIDFAQQMYSQHEKNHEKNVTFNHQVIIIHITGDSCVEKSIEALSKEQDQQIRNAEFRKRFLTKYNALFPDL